MGEGCLEDVSLPTKSSSCLWSLLFHKPLILQFCFHLPSVFSLCFCTCSLFLEIPLAFLFVFGIFPVCSHLPPPSCPSVLALFSPTASAGFLLSISYFSLLLCPCSRIAIQDHGFLLIGTWSSQEHDWGLRKTEKWPGIPEFGSQPQCCPAPMGYQPTWNSMIFHGLSVCGWAVSSHIPCFFIKEKENKSNCWRTKCRRKKFSAQQNWPYKEPAGGKKKISCCLWTH